MIVGEDDVRKLHDMAQENSNEIRKEEIIDEAIRMKYLRVNHFELCEYEQRGYIKDFLEGLNNQAQFIFKKKLKIKNPRNSIYSWVLIKDLAVHKMRNIDEKQLRERIGLAMLLEKLNCELTPLEREEVAAYRLRHNISHKLT